MLSIALYVFVHLVLLPTRFRCNYRMSLSKQRIEMLWTYKIGTFFITCQARVVRFYVSHLSSSSSWSALSSSAAFPSSRRTSTTIVWDQCSAPDQHCESVGAARCAGPQLPDGEISVPCGTLTASMREHCAASDLNHDSVRSRSAPDRKEICQKEWQKICCKDCQKMCQKEWQKICQKECQKIGQKECSNRCQIECQKICRKNMRRWEKIYNVNKFVRKNVRRYVRKNVRRLLPVSLWSWDYNRTHFVRWVICLPSPDPIRLT